MWKTVLHDECEAELLSLRGSNNKLLSKVIYDLKLLREFGLELMEKDRVKKLSTSVYELRTKQGSNINRVLFGIGKGEIFLLAASFVKKTNRTPKGMIKLAEDRLEGWDS